MSLMDFTLDAPDQQQSVDVKRTSAGYRVCETKLEGWQVQVVRVFMAAICFGMMAAGGMVWTLTDTSFPGDPAITKAILSTAIYIVAAALVVNGAFAQSRDEVEIDLKGRVLHIISRAPYGIMNSRKTLRFEEITRIDLAETSLMTELRSAITRLDYGTIKLSAHGGRAFKIVGGDMMDLEPLLSRLRGDTGVA
ncbi:hypothetical protein SAMN05444273_101206 [Litoreibacter ascidiaceicola]|uniref:Uncharacterized protein n=1 Tax=Litoreibacter ascidiaceicola TaxID=1486859 RepID=A0A1M4SVI6_9RHOB|nr:hypothetical protein [Litoreibacter ascidiaceicola]SHE36252.1 hypothetical protein SAMN05444273_101206 [Litoreibacter ascidiaceicola]